MNNAMSGSGRALLFDIEPPSIIAESRDAGSCCNTSRSNDARICIRLRFMT